MQYDPIRAMLAASSEELGRLLEVVIPEARHHDAASSPDAEPAPEPPAVATTLSEAEREAWTAAGILIGDAVHPTVVGMVGVLARPARSVVIERFCRNLVVPLFVACGPQGRATLTDGIPGGDLTVQATSYDLLAPLLMQALHLHRGMPAPDDRVPLTTTAGAMEQWLDPEAGLTGGDGDAAHPELLANVRFAWRASGGWPGGEVDSSITALSAGPLGLWTVTHDATEGDGRSEPPAPDTEVVLEPTTLSALTARLGDVITGRVAVGRREPSTG